MPPHSGPGLAGHRDRRQGRTARKAPGIALDSTPMRLPGASCITSATRRILPRKIQICPAYARQVLKQALSHNRASQEGLVPRLAVAVVERLAASAVVVQGVEHIGGGGDLVPQGLVFGADDCPAWASASHGSATG